jgi:hypothetical protein
MFFVKIRIFRVGKMINRSIQICHHNDKAKHHTKFKAIVFLSQELSHKLLLSPHLMSQSVLPPGSGRAPSSFPNKNLSKKI